MRRAGRAAVSRCTTYAASITSILLLYPRSSIRGRAVPFAKAHPVNVGGRRTILAGQFLPVRFVLDSFVGAFCLNTPYRPARGHARKLTSLVRNYRSLIFRACYRCPNEKSGGIPSCLGYFIFALFLVVSLRATYSSLMRRIMERDATWNAFEIVVIY